MNHFLFAFIGIPCYTEGVNATHQTEYISFISHTFDFWKINNPFTHKTPKLNHATHDRANTGSVKKIGVEKSRNELLAATVILTREMSFSIISYNKSHTIRA